MLRIGLTGGVASGKSAAADAFAELGVPVIDTDLVARAVVAPGSAGLAEVRAAFGDEVLDARGELDRSRLRRRVFGNPAERARLEAILHPLIRAETEALAARAGGPYQVLVVPLLVETGFADMVNRVLVIDSPEELQRTRLMRRDGIDADLAEAMLAAQGSRAERLAAADDVIVNAGNLAELRHAVGQLHAQYLRLSAQPD